MCKQQMNCVFVFVVIANRAVKEMQGTWGEELWLQAIDENQWYPWHSAIRLSRVSSCPWSNRVVYLIFWVGCRWVCLISFQVLLFSRLPFYALAPRDAHIVFCKLKWTETNVNERWATTIFCTVFFFFFFFFCSSNRITELDARQCLWNM